MARPTEDPTGREQLRNQEVRAVEVRVPASTSNLGAGFDCVGMAVDCWLTLVAELSSEPDDAPHLAREGTLAGVRLEWGEDRLVRGFAAACEARGVEFPRALRLRASSQIPVARGLGSSASATVAGAAAANALLGLGLGDDDLISLCASLEGHPDNVTPAVTGGATLTVSGRRAFLAGESPSCSGDLVSVSLAVHEALGFAFAVPDVEVSTAEARAALPSRVSHQNAVRAAALGAALVVGLAQGEGDLLALAMSDVLHVPHRKHLVPRYDGVVEAARSAGAFGATLSGSGSTIVAIAPRELAETVANAMVDHWKAAGISAEVMSFERPGTGYSSRVIQPL